MKPTVYFCTLSLVAILAMNLRAEDGPALQKRVDRLEQELETLKRALKEKTGGADVPADRALILMMEDAALVPLQQGGEPGSERFLVIKLAAANLSGDPQVIDRNHLELIANGISYKPADISENKKNNAFPWGMENNYLLRVSPFHELRLPANSTSSGWVFIPGLPGGSEPLTLELVWKQGDQTQRLDLMGAARNRMDLSVERVGPKQCLGLLTIRGEISGLGADVLVRELEALATDHISRVVLNWEPTASQVPPGMGNWLRISAEAEDRSQFMDRQFPLVPGAIQEFHLAGLPAPDFQPYDRASANSTHKPKIHSDALSAVRVALEDILEFAPRENLLEIIETDHRLVRSAALAVGSGRLLAEDLPVVVQSADASDPAIQEGAIRGLQHFGEPEAIDKLLFWLRKGVEPLSSIAMQSLANSRFPAAQEALLKQLKYESVEEQARHFEQLIRNPRPLLADPLYEFVSQHPDRINPEFLRGLEIVGHPRLLELLDRGLKSDKLEVRDETLKILVRRNTAEGDAIALPWTLEQLRTSPPNEMMLVLLKRVKPPEAVDLLLKHVSGGGDQSSIISTLGLIADPAVADRLKELYPTFPSTAQSELLTIFKNWEVPEFRELAHQALNTDDPAKVRSAASGLMAGEGDRGLPWIGEALERTHQPEIVQILTEELGRLGNAESQAILRKVREMDSEQHRRAAVMALMAIRQRSPGFPLVQQAASLINDGVDEKDRDYPQAIGYLTEAIKLDPQLFEAYQTRGNCLLRIGKLGEAGPDFRKALEIEPYSSDAVTGLCVVMASEGQWEEALKQIAKSDPLFEHELNYQYNSACVYGRIVAYLKKSPDIPDRDKLVERYTAEGLKRLRSSVEDGFEDLNWMKRDPDLESLRDTDGFRKIIQEIENPSSPEGPRA